MPSWLILKNIPDATIEDGKNPCIIPPGLYRSTFVIKKALFCIACILFSTSVQAQPATELATKKISLAVTGLPGLEELQREFAGFQQAIQKATGLEVAFVPITSRTAVVEAIRSKKLDFALTGPAEYVILKSKTEIAPVVAFSRPDYFSAIIVLTNSGITNIKDLKDKKIAFGNFGSTSYHLAPMELLKQQGIHPSEDIKAVNVSRHMAWNALKRGNVDAVGMKHEQFLSFRDKETELRPGAFRVIARGADLPNDVLVAGKHVEPKAIALVKKAFIENGPTLIEAIMTGKRNSKYQGMEFITDVRDKDYNFIRQMFATIGYPEFS